EKHPKATAYQIFCFMDNIALEFYLAQKYSEAVLWRERMLNFCQNNFMDDSPEVSRTLRFLNLAYIKLKAYDKAEPSLKAELAILEKKLTASHRKVIEVKENLADTFHEMKKFDDELRLREQIVELWRENFAANEANKNFLNQEFAQAQEKLASLLDLLGEKERAKDIRSQINYAPDEDDLEALFEEFENLDESQRAKEMRDFEKIKQKCD
ncbi:MAG: tetratricopeptide repeat protein, partial [Selenomonadaceae bacterium]|nr:tetratricopeptide repeat protein [Selenomonadaceae bacterium]